MWNNFKSTIDLLIADEVGKRANRFEEAVSEVDVLKNKIKESIGQVNILEEKIRVLDKEPAAGVVGHFIHHPLSVEDSYPDGLNALSEEALLDVLRDGTRELRIKVR